MLNFFKKYILTLLFLFLAFLVNAQEKGVPFITNFSPKDFKAESQNWCFVQDNNGLIYVGNNMGVLEYDGVSWKLIPTKTVVRSLAIDKKENKIYVGSIDDLGYLERSPAGNLKFKSLVDKIPEKDRAFNSIWATVVTNEGVLFVGSNITFRWYKNEMSQVTASIRTFNLNGTPIFFENNRGMVQPSIEGYNLVEGGSILSDVNVNNILPYNDGSWLVQSRQGELSIVNLSSSNPLRKLSSNATPYMSQNRVYRGAFANENIIGYTTLKGGVVFLDKEGNLQNIIDKDIGLQTNECYTLFEDNQENIWVGTGNGISKIEINSPISYFNDALGLDAGVVIGTKRFKGTIYAGGIGNFYLENGRFKPVPGTSQQVWGYLEFIDEKSQDTKLLVATSSGLGEIKNKTYQTVALQSDVIRCIYQSKVTPERVYVGKSNGLSIIEYKNRQWNEIAVIEDFDLEVRNITEDNEGVVWLGTEYEGTIKIEFDNPDDLSKAFVEYFTTKKGFNSLSGHRVYFYENEVLSANKSGVYKYDKSQNTFIPEDKFGENLTNGARPVMYFVPDANDNIWVSSFKNNKYPIGRLSKKKDNTYLFDDLALRRLPPMEIESIYPEENGIIWIGGTEGLYRYDSRIEKNYTKPYDALIRQITINQDSVISRVTSDTTQESMVVIPFEFNNLDFTYAATSFEDAEALVFSYKLDGDSDENNWSEWSSETRKEYTLSEGSYTFLVKAKNIYGIESKVDSFSFRILPPWYRSLVAYISYLVIAAAVIYLVVYFNTKRLQVQNKKLEELIEKRTLEVRQQNEELERQKVEIITQRNDIETQKNEIETAYDNIQTISEVGQKITSTLDFESLIKTIYNNVNQLLDAAAFGVGIYNDKTQNLEFKGFIERGEELPFFADDIHDETKLSSWCFKNLEPVVINDLREEYNNYVSGDLETKTGEVTESAVYVPLVVENEPIGVITMQSFKKNAYSDLQLTFIQTLASYISVAVDNAKAYEVIKANNANITDSIRYAETIQQAILPSKEKMNEALHEYFVLYKPKDIVSGDFYWFNHIEDKIFIAVTDCTGHGVPGAFMSIVGTNLLNEIINVEKVYDPAKVLELLNRYVTLSLRQNEVNNIDGMDIALIVIETHEDFTTKVSFAGAKRPLYYFEDGDLHKIEGVRKSIGGGKRLSRKEKKFETKEVTLQNEASIYLLSDGYVDQNNIKRERFGSWKLKKVLKEIGPLPMKKQEEILNHYLLEHMRGTPQRDDITILGLRVI